MKPAPFSYHRATSLQDAHEALRRHGPEARIIAGGQSLMPMMALRIAQPSVLVDIGHLSELRGLSLTDGVLRAGALTRHAELLSSPVVAQAAPLLAQAVPHVAHAAIRNRGTLGGSLALADPAAELPACALALNAVIHLHGAGGARVVRASEFFQGLYTTALSDADILTRIEFPAAGPGQRFFFDEVSRRRGDYAMAGLAAVSCADGSVRLTFLGCGDRPLRASQAEGLVAAALSNQSMPPRTRIKAALQQDLDPPSDLQADAATRIHLAAVLVERALTSWCKEAGT